MQQKPNVFITFKIIFSGLLIEITEMRYDDFASSSVNNIPFHLLFSKLEFENE